MIYTTKEDGKTILWGMTTDDKDDAYETVTDKNDVVIFRQVDTGKDFVYNEGEWYEFAESGGGGGGGGALIATTNIQTGALDKTWNEINDADLAFVSINEPTLKATGFVAITVPSENAYFVGAISYSDTETGMGMLHFTTDSADGYPVIQV